MLLREEIRILGGDALDGGESGAQESLARQKRAVDSAGLPHHRLAAGAEARDLLRLTETATKTTLLRLEIRLVAAA
jgi:hypothetical protein